MLDLVTSSHFIYTVYAYILQKAFINFQVEIQIFKLCVNFPVSHVYFVSSYLVFLIFSLLGVVAVNTNSLLPLFPLLT